MNQLVGLAVIGPSLGLGNLLSTGSGLADRQLEPLQTDSTAQKGPEEKSLSLDTWSSSPKWQPAVGTEGIKSKSTDAQQRAPLVKQI